MKKVIFICLCSALMFACQTEDKTENVSNPPIAVSLVSIKMDTISVPIEAHGILTSREQSRLGFKTGGIIQSILVKEGDEIKKGQLLASLDVTELQATYNKALTAHKKALRDLQRIENLYKDSVATLEQLQNVESYKDVTASDLQIIAFNLENSKIVSPVNGKVVRKLQEAGEITGPGIPILVVAGTENDWVLRVGLSESEIVQIRTGDSALIQMQAIPGKALSGSVSEVSAAIDPASGTYGVEIQINQIPDGLLAGFIGKSTIYPLNKQVVTLIPLDALIDANGNDAFVFVPTDNYSKVVKMAIKISGVIGDKVIVLNGLEGTNQIIGLGAAYLETGSMITVKSDTSNQ